MTSVLKQVYTATLDNIVNEYNKTYHRTITVKPVNVKTSTYIDFGVENDDQDPKFEADDHVRIQNVKKFCKIFLSKLEDGRSFCYYKS